ncbi:hypothetical protein [Dyella jejuensis]
MQSFLKILSQMTGLQKLSVVRNVIVLPLLLLSLTLSGGVFGFTAPIVLPWVLYMGFNLGSNSHRLQAIDGFQPASSAPKYMGLSTKVLYLLSCVVGILYIGVIAALLPDAGDTAAPQALQVAVSGAVFFGVFLTIVGVRLGWSSVAACAPGIDPAKTLRLVNPAGVKRQQLIYLAVGVFVLVGSFSSLSNTYPRWAGDGSNGSAALAQDDPSLASLLSDDSTPTGQQPAAPAQPSRFQQGAPSQQMSQQEAVSTPTPAPAQASVQLPSPAAPGQAPLLTRDTYGNAVASYFPGESAQDALTDGLSKISSSLSVDDVDYLGYPAYSLECEKNGQCVNGTGTPFGPVADVAKEMFPVNPSDIRKYGLKCNLICYDSQGQIIGRAP